MMNRVLGMTLAAVTLAVGVGCGGDSGTGGSTGGSVDCSSVKGYAELTTAFDKCTSCHNESSPAAGVPSGTYYDSYDGAKANAGDIAERINDGTMPPQDSEQLTDDEKSALVTWASCDTPQ
jgi:uncharacterized membrane protein